MKLVHRLRQRQWSAWNVALVAAVGVGLPLIVAAIALHRHRYFPVLDAIEAELEQIEERLFTNKAMRENIEALYYVKQKITTLKHATGPLMESVGKLYGGRVPQVCHGMGEYFVQSITNNDINAIKNNGSIPEGYTVNHFLTDPNAWFLTTDVPNGLKHFVRTPLQNSMDGDFDTGNVRYKARERYSFGWSDPLGMYGSQGA